MCSASPNEMASGQDKIKDGENCASHEDVEAIGQQSELENGPFMGRRDHRNIHLEMIRSVGNGSNTAQLDVTARREVLAAD